jgi:transcriptional regulator of acetoin/glycerol metabolism
MYAVIHLPQFPLQAALRLAHGNVSQAARLLGINRTTLYNRMESFAREQ